MKITKKNMLKIIKNNVIGRLTKQIIKNNKISIKSFGKITHTHLNTTFDEKVPINKCISSLFYDCDTKKLFKKTDTDKIENNDDQLMKKLYDKLNGIIIIEDDKSYVYINETIDDEMTERTIIHEINHYVNRCTIFSSDEKLDKVIDEYCALLSEKIYMGHIVDTNDLKNRSKRDVEHEEITNTDIPDIPINFLNNYSLYMK